MSAKSNLLEGAAVDLDLFGITSKPVSYVHHIWAFIIKNDGAAMSDDWRQAGEDISRAIDQYKKVQS